MESFVLAARGARLIVQHCAEVQSGQRVLVISDRENWLVGEAIAAEAHAAGAAVLLLDATTELARWRASHQRPEPPDHLAAPMAASHIVIHAGDVEYGHLLGHTHKNRRAQAETGMLYVHVEEGITAWDTTPEDIATICERTFTLSRLLEQTRQVRVTTPKGTDVTFALKPGRTVYSFVPRGQGNTPRITPHYGESAVVPLEGTAEGRAIIDGIIVSLGQVSEPLEWTIRGGRVVGVDGGRDAARFRRILETDEGASNIAECGIATSHKERRSYEVQGRIPHFAYGAWGSIHLAVGHSQAIGGEVFSKVHIDCQMYDASLALDGHQVMRDGQYLI